jgi:hypothetical protein
MAKSAKRLGNATFVTYGYGQVEPNHMSAKRNGQVYAQLPAAASIELLENGQFVKYDYAKGVCDFDGAGPWRMVFNEVKIYEDRETDADFAMIKDRYNARVYSPVGQTKSDLKTVLDYTGEAVREGSNVAFKKEVETFNYPQLMPDGTKMVPRVIAVPNGDIWTTNTIKAEAGSLSVGDQLKIDTDGYLTKDEGKTATGGDEDPKFVVVKVYTMPDLQPGVKVQRIG